MTWQRAKERARRYAGALVLIVFGGVVLASQTPQLTSLVASTGILGQTSAATVFISAHEESLTLGQTGTLDVRVTTDVPINAIGATLSFDPDALEIVGISKEHSFLDLWTEDTSIREDVGEIHFSGGTVRKNGLQGTATILTLAIRPKREGETSVAFKEALVLASDGRGSAVDNERQTLTLMIGPKDAPPEPIVNTHASGDFNGDGHVTLADLYLSLLLVQPLSPYNVLYDLDRSGAVNLTDISLFFQQMGR